MLVNRDVIIMVSNYFIMTWNHKSIILSINYLKLNIYLGQMMIPERKCCAIQILITDNYHNDNKSLCLKGTKQAHRHMSSKAHQLKYMYKHNYYFHSHFDKAIK